MLHSRRTDQYGPYNRSGKQEKETSTRVKAIKKIRHQPSLFRFGIHFIYKSRRKSDFERPEKPGRRRMNTAKENIGTLVVDSPIGKIPVPAHALL